MGRMLNPAAYTLKNLQGQCSENTVPPVLKIQVKMFQSLELLKSWSLENLEEVGELGSLISMERQLTATKARSDINASVLSHDVFELRLSHALKWAECGLPQLFKDQGHPQQNLCGKTVIHTWRGAKLHFSPTQRSSSQKNRTPLHPSNPTDVVPPGLLSPGLTAGRVITMGHCCAWRKEWDACPPYKRMQCNLGI